jgi:uncharacterized membrane protein YukC
MIKIINSFNTRIIKHSLRFLVLSLLSLTSFASEQVGIVELANSELNYNINRYNKDSELLEIENTFRKAHSNHQQELMSIAETAYKTQQIMTVAIFFIVSVLVLGGFYLSYLQFKADERNQDNDSQNPKATFKISKSGIEFSSSVIGLIVLFMSFMFFHLYVKDVYSIKTNAINSVSFENGEVLNDENANRDRELLK